MQFLPRDLRQQHMPAFEVETVVTTGAGDAFRGALALGLTQMMKLKTNLLRACTTAALTDLPNAGGYTFEV